MNKLFGYTHLFHLQCSKDGSSKFLQNVGIRVSRYEVLHSLRTQSIGHEIFSKLHIKNDQKVGYLGVGKFFLY